MKTERRHELQTNALARSLADWVERAKPYGKAGLALLLAVAVLLFAWAWTSTQSAGQAAAGWTELFEATRGANPDPRETLRDISGRYAGTMVGQWARLTLADLQLQSGTGRLLQDRKIGQEELREAREEYKALLVEASQNTIQQRATYGLARAEEALGELEPARTTYRSLAERWPEGPFAAAAESRANDLERQSTKVFYDWLAKYEPPPPLSNEPGTPGIGPSFLDDPDAGGLLDTPAMPEGGAGPALPSVIEGETTSPEPAAESPADAPATAEEAPSDDTATPPAAEADAPGTEPEPQPAPEPQPEPSDAADESEPN